MAGKKPRIVAIANEKGGVGKTATVVNLSAALSIEGRKVLVVDMDPQHNTTNGLGIDVADDKPYSMPDSSNLARDASNSYAGDRNIKLVFGHNIAYLHLRA